MSDASLYEISDTVLALENSLDACETPEQRVQCEAEIVAQVQILLRKVDSYTQYLGHLNIQAEFAAREIERLRIRRIRFLRTIERLEQYAIYVMESTGKRKLEGKTSQMSLRNNPPAVEIDNLELLPGPFKIVKQEVIPDKRAIKRAIDSGEEVPGAHLAQPKISLVRT
jgi:hypothetical protein